MHRDSTRHARSSWPPSWAATRSTRLWGLAAAAGRFADDDLLSILEHIAASQPAGEVVRADETHSVQSGTIGWQALGQ
ncbi:hypothetical protein FHU36_007500 [Nonomuraea muscovyensis]|uniref:Uncharacterized protein n=1 Tax=Nonomuraea muscovyensis TaxID=1124761 RepID=A0A7X0F0H8_9ACTN|nr:hypothetical protein [Nonomuraea muscovyensis]MBB6350928.1 hypothetical protein [Nonomuraea muscovyensis]